MYLFGILIRTILSFTQEVTTSCVLHLLYVNTKRIEMNGLVIPSCADVHNLLIQGCLEVTYGNKWWPVEVACSRMVVR